MARGLLTLQQSCLLVLITRLDEFSSTSLLLLPRRLQLKLLSVLPPADICHLEKTGVVRTVDGDQVWRNVCENFGLVGLARKACQCAMVRAGSNTSPAVGDICPCFCCSPPNSNAVINVPAQDCTQLQDYSRAGYTLTWREYFTHVLARCLLCPSFIRVMTTKSVVFLDSRALVACVLFTGRECSPKEWISKGYLPFYYNGHCVHLKRFQAYFDQLNLNEWDLLTIQLARVMVTDLNLIPKSLCIDYSQLGLNDSPPWWAATEHREIFTRFLGAVYVLTLRLTPNSGSSGYGYFVLEYIVSLSSCTLESLRIVESGPSGESICGKSYCSTIGVVKSVLVALAPLLKGGRVSKSKEWADEEVEEERKGGREKEEEEDREEEEEAIEIKKNEIVKEWGKSKEKKFRGFSGLRDLQVSSSYKLNNSNSRNAIATRELMSIVANQTHLKLLVLSGFWGWSLQTYTANILQKFCSALFSKSLVSVHLKDIDIPFPVLQELLCTFLQSTESSHLQTFVLQSVWMYEIDDALGGGLEHREMCVSDSHYFETDKSLQFLSMHIPNFFLKWLTTLPYLPLNRVELSDIQYDLCMRPGGMVAVLGTHTHCDIHHLSISCHTVDCPSEDLDVLIRSKPLQSLTLIEPKMSLLSSLVRGLSALSTSTQSSLQYLCLRRALFRGGEGAKCKSFLRSLKCSEQFKDATVVVSAVEESAESI